MTHRVPYKRPVEFKIMCPECGGVHHHKCNDTSGDKLREAYLSFLSWVPEFAPYEKVQKAMQKAGEEAGWLEKGQDFTETPFFGAQPWTYSLGDKHFGRGFSGVIDSIIEAAGFDPSELRQEAFRRRGRSEAEKKAQTEHREKVSKVRADAIALFQSDAPLDEKVLVLDQIISDRTRGLHPTEFVNKEKNQIEDPWLYDTLRYLKDRYQGGVSPEVNVLRIEAARKIALQDGVHLVTFFGANGTPVLTRRFQDLKEVEKLLGKFVTYDGFSTDPLASAVYVKVKTRGSRDVGAYVRGDQKWVPAPVEPSGMDTFPR